MGKILRLNEYNHSAFLYKAQQLVLNLLTPARHIAAQPPAPELCNTTGTLATKTAYSQETLEKLELSALLASAAQPARLYDLSKLLTLEEQSKAFSFDLGEGMARKGLAETCFRAGRICIKITPEGLNYLKEQESEHL
ncbi:hypothetical protein [Pontibacter beigongshangensis]|uniref:hypothetical protein n=1 Tax=Pontibacter beigongshangensis TaxID=2574733 RepID=UPI00164F6254|nr:hypothetical protein [Pontibacter beigongshangensis]